MTRITKHSNKDERSKENVLIVFLLLNEGRYLALLIQVTGFWGWGSRK
jgi:hypothetical protein